MTHSVVARQRANFENSPIVLMISKSSTSYRCGCSSCDPSSSDVVSSDIVYGALRHAASVPRASPSLSFSLSRVGESFLIYFTRARNSTATRARGARVERRKEGGTSREVQRSAATIFLDGTTLSTRTDDNSLFSRARSSHLATSTKCRANARFFRFWFRRFSSECRARKACSRGEILQRALPEFSLDGTRHVRRGRYYLRMCGSVAAPPRSASKPERAGRYAPFVRSFLSTTLPSHRRWLEAVKMRALISQVRRFTTGRLAGARAP